MSRDADIDGMGYAIDLIMCDYCPDGQAETGPGFGSVAHWLGLGWDIDPRPGRDRCPTCATDIEVGVSL